MKKKGSPFIGDFLWYKNAIQVEGGHPMLHGFARQKCRVERRCNFPVESRLVFLMRRARDLGRTLKGCFHLLMEMEEVWLETRKRGVLEARVVLELSRQQQRVLDWRRLRVQELQAFYRKSEVYLERSCSKGIPSWFQLWLKKWNVFSDSLTFTREPLNTFWRQLGARLKRGHLYRLFDSRAVFMILREAGLFACFMFSLFNRASLMESRF